ncbi:MAG: sialate O-acetylesterase [Mucinivorans sp.]
MKKLFIFSILVLATSFGAMAQVKLASAFTDNMVFQQSDTASIWGTAMPATKIHITASWAPKDTVVVQSDNCGRWMGRIATAKADLKAHTVWCNETKISNVLLGEVWIASGQSNMQWSVNHGILYGTAEAAKANNDMIRVFEVPLVASPTPQDHTDGSWKVCNSQVMSSMSAIGYFFASALNRELKVPIGIISSAWGGTPAEPWIPACEVKNNKNLDGKLVKIVNIWNPMRPGDAYNQMIYPFAPTALAGAIWYQGESNRENPTVYDELMTTLITSWRATFHRDFPFYFVQIAPFNYGGNTENMALLREQQELTSLHVPRTEMIAVSDRVNDVNNIHPLDKKTVGERLAAAALAENYGFKKLDYKTPTLDTVTFDDSKATIFLSNVDKGLTIKGKSVVGLMIAGQDGVFVPAQAKIMPDNTIQAWARQVKNPTTVRYCFDDATIGNIFSTAMLPVAPFRSDRKF